MDAGKFRAGRIPDPFSMSVHCFLALFDAEDFYYDSLAALAVEFCVEDALPGAEVEFAVGDGQGGFVVEKEGFEVGVGIVFASLVVFVIGAFGG